MLYKINELKLDLVLLYGIQPQNEPDNSDSPGAHMGPPCTNRGITLPLTCSIHSIWHFYTCVLLVGCWRGYLSGARCRLACGPADATATHSLLLR